RTQRAVRRSEPWLAAPIGVADVRHRRVDARAAAVEDRETHAVETGDAVLRADPDVTGAVLRDRQRRHLRQSVFAAPVFAHGVLEALLRVERSRRSGDDIREHGEERRTSQRAAPALQTRIQGLTSQGADPIPAIIPTSRLATPLPDPIDR